MIVLNTFCANENHVAKANHIFKVKLGELKLEIPLCNACNSELNNESPESPQPSV